MKPLPTLLFCALLGVPAALSQGLPVFKSGPADSAPAPASGGTQNLPDLGDVAQAEMTPAQERRLGEQIMLEVRTDPSYSDDPEITDYLNTLGYRLVSVSSDSRQEFTFFLMMDPQVNAFALPGGFIGINSGLIVTAQSESELAGVVSHEIGHVVQRHFARMLASQKETQLISLAGLVVAILSARASSQVSQAAMAGSQAGTIQSSLNFTRGNEQEADRIGFQILEKGGFDPAAMAAFFERLMHATRFYQSTAPAYLRTHPLTTDRISDMQNRLRDVHYRQVPDSIEFQLMRAKLKAQEDTPRDAVRFFEESLQEKKYLSEAASRYGLVAALLRNQDYPRAEKELQELRKRLPSNAAVETLAARYYTAVGSSRVALTTYREALRSFPSYRALLYGYADLLLRTSQPDEALKLVESRLQYSTTDYQLYQLQARSYAALGKPIQQHRALAEYYYRLGNLRAAVEQLQFAQKAGGGDFYVQSSVDARLRELRGQLNEMRKDRSK